MRKLGMLFCLLWFSVTAQAQLEIEIVKGVAGAIPIAVVPFEWQSQMPSPPDGVADVVGADLARSGLFLPLDEEDMVERPREAADIRFGTWRLLKTDYLVIGDVADQPGGGYDIDFQLFDVNTNEQLLARSFRVSAGELRYGAHLVADAIFEKLTGIPGAFATRIAYVAVDGLGNNQTYDLMVADADGHNYQSLVTSSEPLLSPAWSPDGSRIAYVSFENGNSSVWVQDIYTSSRQLVASHRGINGAPAFSPDGRRLALTLSRSGSPEIYVLDLDSERLTQLTRHYAIDTEPVWSVDGRWIYFTSDRAGKPQIYRIPASGGEPERVTRQGSYNARANLSPDGTKMAVTQGQGNDYWIAVFDLESGRAQILTPGKLDESPSFAPNGSMILYATRDEGRGVLSAVSADGNVRQRLVLSGGDVREPAWSPVSR